MDDASRTWLRTVDTEVLIREIERRKAAMRRPAMREPVALAAPVRAPDNLRHYGVDSRREVETLSGAQRQAAACVAAVFHSERVQRLSYGRVRLQTEQYGRSVGLSPSERFHEQEAGAYATGFLVAPNLLVTAAHAVENLTRRLFVFGFHTQDGAPQTELPLEQVREPAELVAICLDKQTGADWALVRLARPVEGVAIPRIRREGRVAACQALYAIGHPGGLPAKFVDGARVRSSAAPAFFVANLDTYWHSSGSPVFNADDHTIEGVLVRGKDNFKPADGVSGPLVSNSFADAEGRGEDVVRTTLFAHLVP